MEERHSTSVHVESVERPWKKYLAYAALAVAMTAALAAVRRSVQGWAAPILDWPLVSPSPIVMVFLFGAISQYRKPTSGRARVVAPGSRRLRIGVIPDADPRPDAHGGDITSRPATGTAKENHMPKFRTTATRLAAVLAFGAAMLGVTAVAGSPAGAADITRVELRNRSTGLRADVMWASTAVGTGVFLWPDNTSTSQEFNLLDSGGGSFRIQARHSGQCLIPEWRNGPYANGTRIVQHPDCSATYGPGQWHYAYRSTTRCNGDVCSSNSAEPVKLIVNNYTGRCLDTANGTTAKPPVQAALQLWDCIRSTDDWNVKNQSWTVAPPGSILIDG